MGSNIAYRAFIQVIRVVFQFAFFLGLSLFFEVPIKIAVGNFFIFFILMLIEKLYAFKTVLVWEELKKQVRVHLEFLALLILNELVFLDYKNIPEILMLVVLFFVFNLFLLRIFRRDFGKKLQKRVLIIGTGDSAKILTRVIVNNPFVLYNLLGYVKVDENIKIDAEKILCSVDELDKCVLDNEVDEVIVALPKAGHKKIAEIHRKLEKRVEKIKYVSSLNGAFTYKSEAEDYGGIMLVSTDQIIMTTRQRIEKRILDIVLGSIGFLIFGILYIAFGMRIKKEDGGKVLFAHSRIGRGLEPFKMYKFRSMYINSEERLNEILDSDEKLKEEFYKTFKLKDDPRITKIGRFLRETSLDEFPQFLNVLKGKMSIVGPRPIVKKELDMYYGSESGRKVFLVKPGITGMWQANGRSDVEDYDERIALDLYYIRNWSMWLDLIIVMKTIKNVIHKTGAY